MVIGIDLDDTINDLATIITKYGMEYNEQHNIQHEINPNEWDFDKAFGWTETDEIYFRKIYFPKILIEAEPKEKAPEIINKLKEEGHDIIIITARSLDHEPNMIKTSEEWLERYKIKYDNLVINSQNKAEKCLENKVDIFIDDGFNNCYNVYTNAKIPVYIFNSNYNQKQYHPGIERVYSWEEVYEIIQKM